MSLLLRAWEDVSIVEKAAHRWQVTTSDAGADRSRAVRVNAFMELKVTRFG
jgi:hypothetical protein